MLFGWASLSGLGCAINRRRCYVSGAQRGSFCTHVWPSKPTHLDSPLSLSVALYSNGPLCEDNALETLTCLLPDPYSFRNRIEIIRVPKRSVDIMAGFGADGS